MRRGLGWVVLALATACGARTSLHPGSRGAGGEGGGADGGGGQGEGGQGGGGEGGHGGQGGHAGQGGQGGMCSGAGVSCMTNLLGPCAKGVTACVGNQLVCQPLVQPQPEQCNGIDDNCNGPIDDGDPGGGQMCNTGLPSICAAGTTHCVDAKVQCFQNLQPQPEKCNGFDDNCNGITDSDCEVGNCQPSLLVLGSTPSNPNCQDFPIEKGSTGVIQYACAGGMVTATLNGIQMAGGVDSKGNVSLVGTNNITGPDGCTWKLTHTIKGNVQTGMVTYNYAEEIAGGQMCWSPCTEVGTVQVSWK